MKHGKLIVFEGLDGSGKATHTRILSSKLRMEGNSISRISFPDYTQPSSSLVKMYLNSQFGDDPKAVNAYAASSFYAVDRYASYLKFWKTRYSKGQIILCDRYTTSNAVYQMQKLPTNEWDYYLAWLEDYEYHKLELPRPDLVLYLDMPIAISQQFMSQRYDGVESRKDLHEKNIRFLDMCREAGLYSAYKLGWQVIPCSYDNCCRTIRDIQQDIMNIVKEVCF